MARLTLAAIAASLLLAGPAIAATPVELQPCPVSHGATVTLGDLFAGADGSAAKVVVAHTQGVGLSTVLSADTIQIRARSAGLDWSNSRGLHQIIVAAAAADEAQPASATHRRAVRIRAVESHASQDRAAQTLVYARNVMPGEIVQAADMQWSDEAVAAADSPGDPSTVIGKAARWALRAGAAVEMRELDSPKVVRRNDSVDVAFEDDGVSLVLQAKAMADAAVGDSIEVMNTQSKKLIEAVVSGPGRAVVGPEAEALKAQAFDPSIHLAAR